MGLALFIAVVIGWVALGVIAAWPSVVIAVSALPLVISLVTLFSLAPKPFFYAALVLMFYIAFAISQIIVVSEFRWLSTAILGTALAYLAILKFVLQALNARRQSHPASS